MQPLTKPQLDAVKLLILGTAVNKVAKQLKINESTLWHWRQLPQFKLELERQKRETYDNFVNGLRSLTDRAQKELIKLFDDPDTPAPTRLRAIEFLHSAIKPEEKRLDLLEAVKVLTENQAIAPEVLEKISASFNRFQDDLKESFSDNSNKSNQSKIKTSSSTVKD